MYSINFWLLETVKGSKSAFKQNNDIRNTDHTGKHLVSILVLTDSKNWSSKTHEFFIFF